MDKFNLALLMNLILTEYYATREQRYWSVYLFLRDAFYRFDAMVELKRNLDACSEDKRVAILDVCKEFGYSLGSSEEQING